MVEAVYRDQVWRSYSKAVEAQRLFVMRFMSNLLFKIFPGIFASAGARGNHLSN